MIDHDDVRFTSFTRDLARRHRRPRSFPPSPIRSDALEQLCGGGKVPVAPPSSLYALAEGLSEIELPALDDEPTNEPS
jgi:hypothetical protein